MYCRSCGAKTELYQAHCPVCGADQRKRRMGFFLLICAVLACAIFAAVLLLGSQIRKEQTLTHPAAYTAVVHDTADITDAADVTDTADGAATQADDGTIVYVTPSGTKYHKKDCPYLSDNAQTCTLQEANLLGYSPCSYCFGT